MYLEALEAYSAYFQWFGSHLTALKWLVAFGLHDRLLTVNRLKNFGIVEVDICVLCKGDPETRDHLLFQCPYSSYIWTLT